MVSSERENKELSQGQYTELYTVDCETGAPYNCAVKICPTLHGTPALNPFPRSMNPIYTCLAQYIHVIITIVFFSINDFQKGYQNASTWQ